MLSPKTLKEGIFRHVLDERQVVGKRDVARVGKRGLNGQCMLCGSIWGLRELAEGLEEEARKTLMGEADVDRNGKSGKGKGKVKELLHIISSSG